MTGFPSLQARASTRRACTSPRGAPPLRLPPSLLYLHGENFDFFETETTDAPTTSP